MNKKITKELKNLYWRNLYDYTRINPGMYNLLEDKIDKACNNTKNYIDIRFGKPYRISLVMYLKQARYLRKVEVIFPEEDYQMFADNLHEINRIIGEELTLINDTNRIILYSQAVEYINGDWESTHSWFLEKASELHKITEELYNNRKQIG